MRSRILIGLLAVAAGVIVTFGVLHNRPVAAAGDDEQQIGKATAVYADAFNKGDVDGVMAIWAADAEYVDDSGKSTKGRDALSAMYKKALHDNKGTKVQIKPASIRFLKDDVALQDGSALLVKPNGESESSPFTAVWVKKEGKWLLHLVRDLSGQQTAVAPEAENPSAQLKALGWLVGEWRHEGKDAATTLSGRWMKGEKFLVLDYKVQGNKEEILSISQIVGWDPTGNKLHSWVFDSRGGFGEGYWGREGKTWSVECAGVTADGRHGSGTNKWTLVDDNSFTFQAIDRQLDGQPMPNVKITYNRVK